MSSLERRSSGPEVGLDLRSRRKVRTRHALQEAALKLFAEHGYEETTVAQIAALAEVGERTFFVYFPSKEDVLFNGSHEGFADLEQLIQGAPPELSDLAAIEHALTEIHEYREPRDQALHHCDEDVLPVGGRVEHRPARRLGPDIPPAFPDAS